MPQCLIVVAKLAEFGMWRLFSDLRSIQETIESSRLLRRLHCAARRKGNVRAHSSHVSDSESYVSL